MNDEPSGAPLEGPRRRLRFPRPVVVPLVSAVLNCGAGTIALFAGAVAWNHDSTVEWTVATFVLFVLALVYAGVTAYQLFARKTPRIACELALVFVPLAAIAAITWPDPEMATPVGWDRYSSGLRSDREGWLVPVLIVMGIAAGACTPLWTRAGTLIKYLQRGACALALVLVCAGSARSLRYPEPSQFVASLPPAARVQVTEHRYGRGSSPGLVANKYLVEPLPGTRCSAQCMSDLTRMTALDWSVPEIWLLLRRDEAHQLWFADRPIYRNSKFVPFTGSGRSMNAPVYTGDLSDGLAPERWLLIAAALGLLLALGWALYYWSAERQLARLRRACSNVRTDGSTVLQVRDEAMLEWFARNDLPMRNEPSAGSGDADYREVTKVLEVETARLRGALDGLSQRALAARVFALVFLCLCTAPLAGAAVHGVVF